MWFGLLGPPFAWTAQHITGLGIGWGICGVEAEPGAHPHLNVPTIAVAAGGLAVGVAGLVAAIASFLRTRDLGPDPPASRIHFLTILALVTTPLFLAIMTLSGFSVFFLSGCRQS
jgi:hypothetical protein